MSKKWKDETMAHDGKGQRWWAAYVCANCGGVTLANATNWNAGIIDYFPKTPEVDEALPAIAREYLRQAVNSAHAPAGAMMLSASAVDAMLKAKGLSEGSLYVRIERAANEHLITAEMASWAHDVRLDANDQRHADTASSLPTSSEAGRCVDFALALGQFLFVIPSRVARGRSEASAVRAARGP